MAKKKKTKTLLSKKAKLYVGDVVTLITTTTHSVISPEMTVEAVDGDGDCADVVWFTSDDKLERATLELRLLTKLIRS